MEVVELAAEAAHPYYIAVQFHPEFKSRPQRPSPVFRGLLQAVKDVKHAQTEAGKVIQTIGNDKDRNSTRKVASLAAGKSSSRRKASTASSSTVSSSSSIRRGKECIRRGKERRSS